MTNYTALNSLHTYALLGIARATMTDDEKVSETERINTAFKQLLKLVDVPPLPDYKKKDDTEEQVDAIKKEWNSFWSGKLYCTHKKPCNCVWCM